MFSHEYLLAHFHYNPETGKFVRIKSKRWPNVCMFLTSDKPNSKKGYITVDVNNYPYLAHRLAWMYMTGEMPDSNNEIDHINGNRIDNRWCNLRLASDSENMANSKIRIDNSSGYKGVCWSKQKGKWVVNVHFKRKQYYGGSFIDREEAFNARNSLSQRLHGEFHNDGLTGTNK
jgi:hypothetical protein